MALRLLLSKKRRKTDQQKHRRRTEKTRKISDLFFWDKNPLFLFALYFLLGIGFQISFEPVIILLLFFLLSTSLKRSLPGILLFFTAFGLTPVEQQKKVQEVEGIFFPAVISKNHSHFSSGYKVKGILHTEKKSFATTMYFTKAPPKTRKFYTFGTLTKKGRYHYSLKAKVTREIEGFTSLAYRRCVWKEKLSDKMRKSLSKTSSVFFSALFLGELTDLHLRYSFQKLGLSHILAISGFHFAYLSFVFFFLLKILLPDSYAKGIVLLLLTLYFFFLGPSPSIFRAYLVILFYGIAELLGRQVSIYNLLGFSALIEMIVDPTIILHLGFQLSFVSCLSLLLYTNLFKTIFRFLFPGAKEASLFSKHGLLLSRYFQKSLSVCFAVNLMLIPLLLFHFHSYPLLSLFYNLFIPLLCAFCMILFLLFFPIPFFHSTLEKFTDSVLHLVFFSPPFSLSLCSFLSFSTLALTLALFLFIGIAIESPPKFFRLKSPDF